jgi:hypothetical protein
MVSGPWPCAWEVLALAPQKTCEVLSLLFVNLSYFGQIFIPPGASVYLLHNKGIEIGDLKSSDCILDFKWTVLKFSKRNTPGKIFIRSSFSLSLSLSLSLSVWFNVHKAVKSSFF